ncbi:hypothetical protein FRC12_003634 [Ceratobasidium sp. 428]|nr:hypothetical protein FRC12_003634 [Ceratobasidium sp. 428]
MFSLGRPFTALAVVVAFLSPFTRASVPAYGQCGGIGYTGSTVCDSGSVCTYSNDYYSQCVPGTNGGGGGGGSGGSSNATFTNPLKNPNGSDPFMVSRSTL